MSCARPVKLVSCSSYRSQPLSSMGKFSEAFGHSHHKEEPQPPPSFAEATSSTSSTFKPLPQISNGPTTFACLLLSGQDKIRTVNFPEHSIAPIQEAIQRVWVAGVQRQGYTTPQNYEWKLKGNPCTSLHSLPPIAQVE